MRYHDTLPSGGKPPILRVLAQCRRASPYLGQPQVTRQLAHRREQSARHKLPCGDVQANLRPNLLIRWDRARWIKDEGRWHTHTGTRAVSNYTYWSTCMLTRIHRTQGPGFNKSKGFWGPP